MTVTRRLGAWRATMLLAAGLALAGAETAKAGCIEEPVASAARLHEFEMLMMDVSLRCTRIGVAMQPHYEAMVTAHQRLFDDAARRLQSFFATNARDDAHHRGLYDRYATLIANRYGGGNSSLDRCRMFDALAVEVVRAADAGHTLGIVAQGLIAHPLLEIATCPSQP
jgi:hypothetical protein